MLAADGQEIVLWRTSTPRWRNTALGYASKEASSFYESGVATDTDSLFRVWASDLDDPARTMGLGGPLPLTEAAQKAAGSFDPVNDTTEIGCSPKGMPLLMGQPQPMEFVDEGDTILLRLEEYETVRTIHMNASASAETRPRTLPGYSIGRWDGKTLVVDTGSSGCSPTVCRHLVFSRWRSRLTIPLRSARRRRSRWKARSWRSLGDELVVTTTLVSWPYFDDIGTPQTDAVRAIDNFALSDDQSRLDFAMTITDPATFKTPAVLKGHWLASGDSIQRYDCQAN